MKVAIVSFELEGLTKNGGIGTAYRRLAEELVEHGHQVTVVFLPFGWPPKPPMNRRKIAAELTALRTNGIDVVFPEQELDAPPVISNDGFHLRRSWLVYRCLEQGHFDVVHASDNCALTYVSLLAKRAGLAFQQTHFVLGTHGSLFWTAEANGQFSESSVLLSRLDELSLGYADAVVSPSRYMINYLKSRDVALPPKTLVIPNINHLKPTQKSRSKKTSTKKMVTPKTLIFFGRLERRKGIYLFADAIGQLLRSDPSLGKATPLKVIFLGSLPSANSSSIEATITEQLAPFGARVKTEFKSHLSSKESQAFLKSSANALVCMPSLMDNSPYVIVEAIEQGFDFFATTIGGQAELIHAGDRSAVLCEPTVESVTAMLKKRLTAPAILTRPSDEAFHARQKWVRFHETLRPRTKSGRRSRSRPLVSIVIGAQRSPLKSLAESLQSALSQTYPRQEILLAKGIHLGSRSNKIKSFDSLDGDAWISAAKTAKGHFILFLDGAALHDPATLEAWVNAALTCEQLTNERFAAHHGIVQSPSSSGPRARFALPSDPLRLVLGQCLSSRYVLWNRAAFLKVARRQNFDLTNDLSFRDVSAALAKSGSSISSFPLETVRTFRPEDIADESSIHLTNFETLDMDPSTASLRLRALAAGLFRELTAHRHELHRSQMKLVSLEKIRKTVLRSSL